jgi:uncharacterized protein YfbU (UPF0304 family)
MKFIEYPEAYQAAVKRNIINNAMIGFRRRMADADEIVSNIIDGADKGNSFMQSLLQNYQTYGSLTDKQCQTVRDSIARLAALKVVWAEKNAEKSATRAYIGEAGAKKVQMTLTVKKIIKVQGKSFSYYDTGMSTIYLCEDSDGNAVTYKGNMVFPDEGDSITVVCTIKSHTEYNGAKQTTIIRAKAV